MGLRARCAVDQQESRDAHAIITERHCAGSMIVAFFSDPIRAPGAIGRSTSNACDLVIEGESYRARLKPGRKPGQKEARRGK